TISKDTYNYFRDNLPSDFDEIVLLYNAIDYGRFNANAKKKNEEQKLKLITVGSLVDNKNQIFLIKVVKYLKEQGLNVQLDILGEGPNRNLLSKRIEEEGLEAAVHLHGNVNEVEEYLWESQIYVHAAKSEAFGLVLVEAMSAGLPVVTLDGNGNRDLIEEGKNGYMVFEADIVAFSEKIILLHQNKFLYKDISKYATQYAKQYDINTYVNQLISLYDKALLKR
ncbi:MAG: glycosyltransferase involved in cell wall biosynthesis, partial [Patescibacteria group bacterium]